MKVGDLVATRFTIKFINKDPIDNGCGGIVVHENASVFFNDHILDDHDCVAVWWFDGNHYTYESEATVGVISESR